MPEEIKKKNNYVLLSFWLIAFIALSWVGTIVIVPIIYGSPTGAGTFGDMFGSLNALFSGLAFVGVIIAILLQKNELELQREELQETRDVLKGQKLQLEEQNKTLSKQNFEGTFFQLLRLYNDVVNSIDIDINQNTSLSRLKDRPLKPLVTGRDVFVTLYYKFSRAAFNIIKNDFMKNEDIVISKIIEDEYESFYKANQSDLGHYFRTIYNLIKFVDVSDIKNKKFYTDILRAQLSSHELLLFHYNIKSNYGTEKMSRFVKS